MALRKPDQQRYISYGSCGKSCDHELSYLDGQGKEQLKVSRLEPDSVGSGKIIQLTALHTAVSDKIWFGPANPPRLPSPT